MELSTQKKRKRQYHHCHQQQNEAPLAIKGTVHQADSKSKPRKKRSRQQAAFEGTSSALNGAQQSYTSHVGVDKNNSNWQQLQAVLKNCAAAGRSQSLVHGKRDGARGTAESKPGNSITTKMLGTLSPKNGDHSLTNVVAMDCEMVGAGLDGKRSILARVSLVNSWGNIVYDKHVKPLEHVTDYRTKVSGVRARDLKKGESFAVVQKEVFDLISGRVLVGHSVENDLKILYVSHPRKDIRDTAAYPPLRNLNGRKRALRQIALELLGVEIQTGEHCSIEDARAAMYIYQHLKRDWEIFMLKKHKNR
ncbi:hypothetical protein KP509_1Z010200 [Ceratopteris richardii]|nr:hypothetical protein KP509_1Z010200 [Ceratopteris richardii]